MQPPKLCHKSLIKIAAAELDTELRAGEETFLGRKRQGSVCLDLSNCVFTTK
jgi:hypothetical protein